MTTVTLLLYFYAEDPADPDESVEVGPVSGDATFADVVPMVYASAAPFVPRLPAVMDHLLLSTRPPGTSVYFSPATPLKSVVALAGSTDLQLRDTFEIAVSGTDEPLVLTSEEYVEGTAADLLENAVVPFLESIPVLVPADPALAVIALGSDEKPDVFDDDDDAVQNAVDALLADFRVPELAVVPASGRFGRLAAGQKILLALFLFTGLYLAFFGTEFGTEFGTGGFGFGFFGFFGSGGSGLDPAF